MHHRRLLKATVSVLALSAASVLVAAPEAHARVTKIQITSKETAFGGYRFSGVGAYEKIVGKAFGELDPKDPRTAVSSTFSSRRRTPTARSSTRSISIS
jgi:hypothetical protein